jgi:hypothetical protein
LMANHQRGLRLRLLLTHPGGRARDQLPRRRRARRLPAGRVVLREPRRLHPLSPRPLRQQRLHVLRGHGAAARTPLRLRRVRRGQRLRTERTLLSHRILGRQRTPVHRRPLSYERRLHPGPRGGLRGIPRPGHVRGERPVRLLPVQQRRVPDRRRLSPRPRSPRRQRVRPRRERPRHPLHPLRRTPVPAAVAEAEESGRLNRRRESGGSGQRPARGRWRGGRRRGALRGRRR